MNWGEEAEKRLTDIAKISADGPGVTRLPFTSEHQRANEVISGWMRKAGLHVSLDSAGTLIGRTTIDPDLPVLLIGSHQDSVKEGGAYDGIMGICLGCLALEKLRADGVTLPYVVEILAFADEEGVRFPTALMGPRALAGRLDPSIFEMTDSGGVRMGDALSAFGGDPEVALKLTRDPSKTLGYFEMHIEQGPVLESEDTSVGIVTGICGIERLSVTFSGETGHAGTVPMKGRKDALVAASDFVSAVHDAGQHADDIRATVGSLTIQPNVVNAIPREATLTLEVRSVSDEARRDFVSNMQTIGETIAKRRDCQFKAAQTYAQPAVTCATDMMDALRRAASRLGIEAPVLPSGATHDASAMSDLCPTAMLFVRCRDGISHHPAEYASPKDMGCAVDVAAEFLSEFARRNSLSQQS